MAVTVLEENDASITYSGFATVDANTLNSNSRAVRSTVNNDTMTFVAPTNCRAVYLGGQGAADYGPFNVTVDGVAAGTQSQYIGMQQAVNNYFARMLNILYRDPSSTIGERVDKPHTIVVTNTSTSKVSVDFLYTVNGGKIPASPGTLVCIGDSWTVGAGVQATWGAYAPRLTSLLQSYYRRPINLSNQGLNGDATYGATSVKTGLQWRVVPNCINLAPEFVVIQFGANDLSNQNTAIDALTFARNLYNTCCLIEDSLDVYGTSGTPVKVCVCTPPWLTPAALTMTLSARTSPTLTSGRANLETAAMLVRQLPAIFPWLVVGDTFSAFNYNSSYLYPNNNNDAGLHPNELGHSAMAAQLFSTITSRWP